MFAPMDQELFIKWASLLMPIGVGIYAWFTRRDDGISKKLGEIDLHLVATDTRISKLETVISEMPRQGDFHRLELVVNSQHGEISNLLDKVKMMSTSLTRIEEFLIATTRAEVAPGMQRQRSRP